MRKTLVCIAMLFFINTVQGQVLISLIFGDKLNSDKIEFGLEGGLINSNILNLEGAERMNGFNLGFYFDFKVKHQIFIHTGVIVKSPLGAKGLERYPTGNIELDLVLEDSEVSRKLRYFNVPVLLKYKFSDQLFIEGGTQLGLLIKAFDQFESTSEMGGDIIYTTSVKDQTSKLDIGVAAGLGFKIIKKSNVKLGIRYYQGFIDINKNNSQASQTNSGLYVYAGIPIGVKKAKEAREAKRIEESQNQS